MSKDIFLGIDTSNYTTSVAVAERSDNGEPVIIANLKKSLPVDAGERGLRQSDAVFAHVKNLPELLAEAREYIASGELKAVSYSGYPRDCKGSYMPCFLSGRVAAASAAASANVPLYQYSHQAGHIRAAVYSSGMKYKVGERFAAFHVSGGTTEVLSVTAVGTGYEIKKFGGTNDISAGQAIDRVGVMMGLRFPCGAELEKLAAKYDGIIPKTKISVLDTSCNLSGLENLATKMRDAGAEPPSIAAFTLDFIGRTLAALSSSVRVIMPGAKILYSGGVMSNSMIKSMLSHEGTYFAEPAFSADNAAGVALLGAERYASEKALGEA